MKYISVEGVLRLHSMSIKKHGGSAGIRDRGLLESAVSQPQATFDGQDLYPGLFLKAGALAFFIVSNHPFVDGNKRTGHMAMETFLQLNGYEIIADVEDQEKIFLRIAAGEITKEEIAEWLAQAATLIQ